MTMFKTFPTFPTKFKFYIELVSRLTTRGPNGALLLLYYSETKSTVSYLQVNSTITDYFNV